MGRTVWAFVRAWVFLSAIAAWLLALVLAFRGMLLPAAVCAAFALGADITGRIWSRRSPMPLPHFLRWVLYVPRGLLSPRHLKGILEPRSGERILEVGPGVGIHALPVAASLLPGGVLDALDVQQEMLDVLMERAARKGVTNIVPRQGDARQLPYPDRTFDAAYLVGVLGEIPDGSAALRELYRVLKPGGRLVVAEMLIDPDFISLGALRDVASSARFVLVRKAGPGFAYCAVLHPVTAVA